MKLIQSSFFECLYRAKYWIHFITSLCIFLAVQTGCSSYMTVSSPREPVLLPDYKYQGDEEAENPLRKLTAEIKYLQEDVEDLTKTNEEKQKKIAALETQIVRDKAIIKDHTRRVRDLESDKKNLKSNLSEMKKRLDIGERGSSSTKSVLSIPGSHILKQVIVKDVFLGFYEIEVDEEKGTDKVLLKIERGKIAIIQFRFIPNLKSTSKQGGSSDKDWHLFLKPDIAGDPEELKIEQIRPKVQQLNIFDEDIKKEDPRAQIIYPINSKEKVWIWKIELPRNFDIIRIYIMGLISDENKGDGIKHYPHPTLEILSTITIKPLVKEGVVSKGWGISKEILSFFGAIIALMVGVGKVYPPFGDYFTTKLDRIFGKNSNVSPSKQQ